MGFTACQGDSQANNESAGTRVQKEVDTNRSSQKLFDPQGNTLKTRIRTPSGFQRTEVPDTSFKAHLRNLPLKPHGSKVKYYDGRVKSNAGVYIAVIDKEIGNKDLHQCADAVIRLRAEYLWKRERYDQIHFNFTNGFRVDYTEWMKGKRVKVESNNAYWIHPADASNTYSDFWNYLETIFTYAGSLSLEKELTPVKPEKLQIGDVFIQGGSPGHAVIIADMAVHPQTKEKRFLLAQSYMPAQEIQILQNPNNEAGNPWYPVDFGDELHTPEWTFNASDLKRFEGE
jgi:hypothetical protein